MHAIFALLLSVALPFAPFVQADKTSVQDVTLTPDGNELYLTQIRDATTYTIVVSTRDGSGWSAPHPVSFSGRWRDLEEILSPDGNTMVFASSRPTTSGGELINGFWSGQPHPGRGGNLWMVQRGNGVWGEPLRLPNAININTSTFSPALASDGTLYYMSQAGTPSHFHLYASKKEAGSYNASSPLPFFDNRYSDFDPTVAADNSFLIFGSNRPHSKKDGNGLFITYNRGGTWTPPQDLGDAVNPNNDATEPRLGPDSHTLYFSSSAKIFSADIAPPAFAPEILSGTLSPTFSPDAATMMFTNNIGDRSTIFESQLVNGAWMAPTIASFSGKWGDMDPAYAADGSFIVFASLRRTGDTAKAHLWRARRNAGAWAEPTLLPLQLKSDEATYAPSIASDGTIYFLGSDKSRVHQLYRARQHSGAYRSVEPLSFSTPTTHDADPAISLDQTFVVFASSGRHGADMKHHLYVVHASGNGWGRVEPLRYPGDYSGGTNDYSPLIGRDGKTVYFTSESDGKSNVRALQLP
jgi:Tol biopolymer transport system component